MNPLGLIAGGGELPLRVLREATRRGEKVIAFAAEGITSQEIEKWANRYYWFKPGQAHSLFDQLSRERIHRVVAVGPLPKLQWLKEWAPDLPNQGDSHLFQYWQTLLKNRGIELLDPILFLPPQSSTMGLLAGPPLTSSQEKDVEFAFQIAKAVGLQDIGQTVVIKDKVVLAVEALEGTDEAILRGAQYGGSGIIVAKIAKPGQDLRLDRPVVGLQTVKTLCEVNAGVLAIEWKKVLFLDMEESIELAVNKRLPIVSRKL